MDAAHVWECARCKELLREHTAWAQRARIPDPARAARGVRDRSRVLPPHDIAHLQGKARRIEAEFPDVDGVLIGAGRLRSLRNEEPDSQRSHQNARRENHQVPMPRHLLAPFHAEPLCQSLELVG